MSVLDDLIKEIPDSNLRDRINAEFSKLKAVKKFGLVFEPQKPEVTPLYDMPIKVNSLVAEKLGRMNQIYRVQKIEGDDVTCTKYIPTDEIFNFKLNQLVRVALFGDPIYPYLQKLDEVCNAPDSDLWHTLIEADNYHALQLLQYVCKDRKVDCIYIDPPYNTGAKDWKYNNDYVDGADEYRHSKWLSMMQRRLWLAKQILNPKTGVLIVTIDEKEYLHLGCLLEEIFPNAYIQTVTVVINPKGSTRGRFSKVEEYAIYCFMPEAYVDGGNDSMLGEQTDEENLYPRWKGLLRSGEGSRREDSKNLFYPILIDESKHIIVKAGQPVPFEITPDYNEKIEGYSVAYPIKNDLTEGRWMLSSDTFNQLLAKGYIALGRYDRSRNTWGISYLSRKYQEQIQSGELKIVGMNETGQTVIAKYDNLQVNK